MSMTIRTSITLPADLFEAAKTAAFYRRTSVSELIRTGLQQVLSEQKSKRRIKAFVGGRALGIQKFNREDVYESNPREEMSP